MWEGGGHKSHQPWTQLPPGGDSRAPAVSVLPVPQLSEVVEAEEGRAKTMSPPASPHSSFATGKINMLLPTEVMGWALAAPPSPAAFQGKDAPQGGGTGLAQQPAQLPGEVWDETMSKTTLKESCNGAALHWALQSALQQQLSARSATSQAHQYQHWECASVCSWRPELTLSKLLRSSSVCEKLWGAHPALTSSGCARGAQEQALGSYILSLKQTLQGGSNSRYQGPS